MSDSNLIDFQDQTSVHFTNQELLQQAFVHRSYLNEHRTFPLEHNERLEFLGDAVLDLCVTEFLYQTYPNPEGELTNWRSALVKGEMLAKVALNLGFSDHLLMSYGENKSGGKSKNYILANAFEAVLGAMYLDQGYTVCQDYVGRYILVHLPEILDKGLFLDPKSRLQEYTQENLGSTPNYQVISEEGPDHAKTFTVAVFNGSAELARGTGASKQSAQVAAAQAALELLVQEI